MDDLLILVAVALWLSLWWARDIGRIGVRRGQWIAAARHVATHGGSESAAEGEPDRPYVDLSAARP